MANIIFPRGFVHKYPYSDFHELNLDWILETVQKMSITVEEFINEYGTPTAVEDSREMKNPNKIYVYVGETNPQFIYGHWYFYDTESNLWTDGGKYGAFDLDTALSTTSENAVQNKVITKALNDKQNKLTFPLAINQGGTGQPTHQSIFNAFKATSGSIVSQHIAKWGLMVHFNMSLRSRSTPTPAGENCWEGTIDPTYKPFMHIMSSSYIGHVGLMTYINSDTGLVTVRVIGDDVLNPNSEFRVSGVYML